MAMKFSTYSKYKPSGVEWIGDVPEHWCVKRLKMAAHLTDKKIVANDENPVPYIGMENIESWTGRLLPIDPNIVPTGTANAFKAGHTLFGKLRPYLAKACNPDFDGLCSTELLVLNGVEFDRDSLRYSLLSDGFIKLVDSSTYGSKMPRASWDFIGNCILPIAPPVEQRSIAAFLDRETRRMDRLVEKKQELIERLKEKRTALISRTVTRGLPAEAAAKAGLPENPPLKPSGLDWIGDIPKHWGRLSKLARFASRRKHSFVNGPFGSDLLTSEISDEGVPVVYIRDISAGSYRRTSEGYVSPEKAKELNFCRVDPGDVLVAKVGDPPGAAAVYPASEPSGIVTQDVIRIRVEESSVFAGYLAYFLNSSAGAGLIDQIAIESTRMRVSLGDYKSSTCPLPPLPEQTAIAAYLDEETAKLDALVGKVEAAVERLQEYRTALITAVVTGKIDVREDQDHDC